MLAEELINQVIPTLRRSDVVETATDWMNEYRINELPVVEDELYFGMVSDATIALHDNPETLIGELQLIHQNTFVRTDQHLYEIIRTAHNNNVDTLPVLHHDNTYVGVITIRDTIKAIAKKFTFQMDGGIIILSMDYRDYSLSEISRLVEANNVRILSSSLEPDEEDPMKVKLTIKFNTLDLKYVVATLERYEYKIIAKFLSKEDYNIETERLNMLFKYLSI
jgi:predicted transcriptional regulator